MSTHYQVNEAGAKTLREARPMSFGLNRYVTADVTDDGRVAVFVGRDIRFDGELPEGLVHGSPEFYQWVRDTATAAETAPAPVELSPGWQVAVWTEAADGSFPYVTDRDRVVGAIAELVGADLADDSPTIEQVDELVEAEDAELGVWLVPLTAEQAAEVQRDGHSEWVVDHPMGGAPIHVLAEWPL